MKKLSKLLCAILVLAMLASSLAFIVSAEEGADITETEEFVPSATVTSLSDIGDFSSYMYESEDNKLSSVSISQYEGDYELKVVTLDGNSYVRLDTVSTGDPKGHFQWSIYAEDPLVYDGAPLFVVFDMDVATESELTALSIINHNRTGANGAGKDAGNNGHTFTEDYITVEPGIFSHLTLVYDYTNNVYNYFLDGQFIKSDKIYPDTVHEQFVAGLISKDANGSKIDPVGTMLHPGIKIQAHSSYKKTPTTAGETLALDNVNIKVLKGDEADNLADALTAGNISLWSGNMFTEDYVLPVIPAIVAVNGVDYSSTATASGILAANANDANVVEFKRAPAVPMAVNANAVVNTNGMKFDDLVKLTGECKIVSEEGNFVTLYTPFVGNEKTESIPTSSVINLVKAPNADNMLGSGTFSEYNADKGRATYVVTDTITGKKIICDTTFGENVEATANVYIDWKMTDNKKLATYELGVDQFIVFDIDFAIANELADARKINLNPITRNSGGGGVWGNSAPMIDDIYVAAGIGSHEFAHITAVLSPDTRELTVFVNGQYVSTTANAISSISGGHYFDGFRTFSNGNATAYYSNASLRSVKSSELTEAINAGSISLWSGNLYGADYELPGFPAIATVDGVPYGSEASLERALYGNKEKPVTVKILHAFDNVITVNCDAVIYTYGQDVTFVDPDGNKLTSDDGVLTYDAPYLENRVEQILAILGQSYSNEVLAAIKSPAAGNLLASFYHHSMTKDGKLWGTPGFRQGSLVTNVDTGDVFYRETGIPDENGEMKKGTNEYVNMNFSKVDLKYESTKNEYIVVDLDFGTDGELVDDIALQIIPRSAAGGAWASDIYLKDLPITSGEMAHVTVIFDYTNNLGHVFVDGVFVYTVDEAAMDGDFSGAREDGSKWQTYVEGTAFTVSELKLTSDGKLSTVCIDNLAIRAYDFASAIDPILVAIDSGYLSDWSGNVYNEKYVTSKLPTIAYVDGVGYGSTEKISEVLATETDGVKYVDFMYAPTGLIKVSTDTTVETHGFPVSFDSATGLYQFENNDKYHQSTGTNLAYASSRIAQVHNVGETVYKFVTITEENCMHYATPVVWFNSIDPDTGDVNVDVVYYVYGDEIAPITDTAYVEGGKLYKNVWKALSTSFVVGDAVDSFPVASAKDSELWYVLSPEVSDADFAATDMQYSANVSTSIKFFFYVSKAQTTTDTGVVTVIGGTEYVTFVYDLAPHEIGETITVEFDVVDENGVSYVQRQKISFVEYAESILKSDETELKKTLVMALLNYANEAHALFDENGEKLESVSKLLEEYSEYLPAKELTEKLDTSALRSVIRSAALRLNANPEFVFKIAKGFRGTIAFTYISDGEEVTVTKSVDARFGEQLVTLSLSLYDVHSDITVTVNEKDSETPVVGKYNLASYAQSLENNGFATALYSYSIVAAEYKSDCYSVTVDGEVVAEYYKGSKIEIPFVSEDLDIVWYLGEGEDRVLIDFDTYVINEDVVLSYDKSIVKTVVDTVSSETLNSIVAGKIKQMDQSTIDDGTSGNAYGYFTKEGGTPVYVTVNKGGELVEGIYFSRSYEWKKYGDAKQNDGWVEHRYALDQSKKVISISFDYIINGTVESQYKLGEGYFQTKTLDSQYHDVVTGDSTYIEDGEWHTFTYTLPTPEKLDCVLIKLYHLQGEFIITNLVITYA